MKKAFKMLLVQYPEPHLARTRQILKKYPELICDESFCMNSNVLELTDENGNPWIEKESFFEKMDWASLCCHSDPQIFCFLEKHIEYIDWDCLSWNPYGLSLLEKYPENINWNSLSDNPSIFVSSTHN